jgi:DNA-binding response OmpR family regulator
MVGDRDQRIAELVDMLTVPDVDLHRVWRFTPCEDRALRLLLKGGLKTRELLMNFMYDDKQPTPHVLDIFIMSLRQKLAPQEIVIDTIYGRGFRISDKDIARVKHLCKAQEQAA